MKKVDKNKRIKLIRLDTYPKCNLGDDLFISIISERYRKCKFDLGIRHEPLKKNTNVRYHFGLIASVAEKLLKKEVCDVNKKYDLRIILGGSMFIEQNMSKKELQQQLNNRYYNPKKPYYILGANFGPYKNSYYYDLYKRLFNEATDVCFRENYSKDLFPDSPKIRVAPDIVFGLDTSEYKITQEKKVIFSVINLEKRKELVDYRDLYEKKVAELADYYAQNGYDVVLMSFCKKEGDEEAINRITLKTKHDSIRSHFYRGDIRSALNEIASSRIVVGTRFHSIVLGFVFGKKVLPIIYSKKTTNMLKDAGSDLKGIEITNLAKLIQPELYLVECSNIDKLKNGSYAHFRKLDQALAKGEYEKN